VAKLKNSCITCHTSWYCDPPTATGMAEEELLKECQYVLVQTSTVA